MVLSEEERMEDKGGEVENCELDEQGQIVAKNTEEEVVKGSEVVEKEGNGTEGKEPEAAQGMPSTAPRDEGQQGKTPGLDGSEYEGRIGFIDTTSLQSRFMDMLGTVFFPGGLDDEEKAAVLGENPTLEAVAERMKTGEYKKVVVMTGAGISVSAGIPDFRSPGSGLYHNLQQYNLPSPQAMFEIGFFTQNPQPFYTLAKELYPGLYKPTKAHMFIRLLQQKGILHRCYTQNVDGLDRIADIDPEKLVEAHGTFATSTCIGCKEKVDTDKELKNTILRGDVPRCKICSGIMKPDLVFFSEPLPKRFFALRSQDLKDADLLLIMGTSLSVQPFASLPRLVRPNVPRVLINNEIVGEEIFSFDTTSNYRDVQFLGTTDEGCSLLAELVGWKAELDTLVVDSEVKHKDRLKRSMSVSVAN